MDSLNFDFLVAIHAVTSNPNRGQLSQHRNTRMILQEDDSSSQGKIIEIFWCVYDLRQQLVTDEAHFFVRPLRAIQFSPDLESRLGVTLEQIEEEGVSLTDVINTLNDYVYETFMRPNHSFCFVTAGNDLLTRTLPVDAREAKIKLQPHFFQYFDIHVEFNKAFPQAGTRNVLDMIQYLKLKEMQAPTLCQLECKSITRVMNRLAKDGHRFDNPLSLNVQHQPISAPNKYIPKEPPVVNKWSSFIGGKAPEPFRNPLKTHFIRLRGLPYSAREYEILEFLRGIRASKEDIAIFYDFGGKFSGEAYVKLHNEADVKEACSFHMSEFGKRAIEVFEANESDYIRAKQSALPDRRDASQEMRDISNVYDESVGIVKLRGLPYSCTDEDIREFFKGFAIKKDGLKRAVRAGKPSGECFVVFENREQAYSALSLNMEKIGSRFIEVFLSNPKELEHFMHQNFGNSAPVYGKEHMPQIPLEKKKCTLMVVGLPFTSTLKDVKAFFNEYSLDDSDIHLLKNSSGKFGGNALVTFEDEIASQRAMKQKNLTYMGSRYIEIFEYR